MSHVFVGVVSDAGDNVQNNGFTWFVSVFKPICVDGDVSSVFLHDGSYVGLRFAGFVLSVPLFMGTTKSVNVLVELLRHVKVDGVS